MLVGYTWRWVFKRKEEKKKKNQTHSHMRSRNMPCEGEFYFPTWDVDLNVGADSL